MNTLLNRAAMAALLTLAAGAAVAGPIGTYYLTDLGNGKLDAIQGSTFNANTLVYPGGESPIAVIPGMGLVRTTGTANGYAGAEYSGVPGLTLTPTGTTHNFNLGNIGLGGDFLYDGTSDGSYNYSVGASTGYVFRFDLDWANPTVLFGTSMPYTFAGITYDKSNNSLWLANGATGGFYDFSLSGTLLSSFATPAGLVALAMDVDHTLWAADSNNIGTIAHYATDGTYLGSDTYAGLGDAFGGEIALPEPTTLALFGIGLLGLTFGRRRKA